MPPLDREVAASVLASIRHRGPDSSGEYSDPGVWLGHVRLSIIDLSSAGNQPMSNDDGGLVISYNGEVYNFRDLSRELSLSNLRSSSDTEVVLRAFEVLGRDAFEKLNGMFAFALYDKRRRKLWLVRDRLGIKPLYYQLENDRLCFGSEIKSVLALTGESPQCDLDSLSEWLYYGNALGGRTLYRGIRQLNPGCYLELDLETFTSDVKEYWSLQSHVSTGSTLRPSSIGDAISSTRTLLEAAVGRQLVADVPVGVFLSGGVDSSAITAIASKHVAGKLATYSAGFDDLEGVDERPKARRVATHFGTDHHEMYITGGELPRLVEKMVHHHDQPFSDSANIPLYMMAAEISREIKVVLQGDGGDELFGGYRRYVSLRYRDILHRLALGGRPFEEMLPDTALSRRVRRYLNAYGADDVSMTMARLLTPVDPRSAPEAVFSANVRERMNGSDPFARYRECQRAFEGHDIGNQMSFVDMTVELPDIFLEKVDRSTMAASLEVRVPFLDHDLVDYVTRLPGSVKMSRGRKKWLLKKALEGLVPHDVLYGPKTGFGVPFGFWLRSALRGLFFDHLETFSARQPGVLDVEEIRRRYTALAQGEHDRAYTLWNLLNLMIWCNHAKVTISP